MLCCFCDLRSSHLDVESFDCLLFYLQKLCTAAAATKLVTAVPAAVTCTPAGSVALQKHQSGLIGGEIVRRTEKELPASCCKPVIAA